MGMVVRSNIMAVNAQRQLGVNNNQVSKALEKLSSGYRINRAGDDASGLAISEKMKSQIKGLDTASLNAQDGISVVQTAEGALTEVHNMLNRMTELATRSANGINAELNRESLQKEVNKLQEEIDRISQSTNFNGIKLLDGSLGGGGSAAIANIKIENLDVSQTTATKGSYIAAKGAGDLSADFGAAGDSMTYSITYSEGGKDKTFNLTLTDEVDEKGNHYLQGSDGKKYDVVTATGAAKKTDIEAAVLKALKNSDVGEKFTITDSKTFTSKAEGTAGAIVKSIGVTENIGGTAATVDTHLTTSTDGDDAYPKVDAAKFTVYDGTNAEKSIFTVNGQKFAYVDKTLTDTSGLGKDVNVIFTDTVANGGDAMATLINQKTGLTVENAAGALTFKPSSGSISGSGLVLQIGDTADSFNQITVNINDMSSKGIGVSIVDISSREGAASAIDTIRNAIDTVSDQRAELGATQNRLEYTINNLDTASENLQSANSRIRDTDMAKMMMEYTKVNVLTQSAQAMLAQANQQPQSVLQLLQ